MSLANRIRQYKMFMERGQTELAKDQVKNHPEVLKEVEKVPQKEEVPQETKSKRKK